MSIAITNNDTILHSDDAGRSFEAEREPHTSTWQINWPEGGKRFAGTPAEVRKEIARISAELASADEEAAQ